MHPKVRPGRGVSASKEDLLTDLQFSDPIQNAGLMAYPSSVVIQMTTGDTTVVATAESFGARRQRILRPPTGLINAASRHLLGARAEALAMLVAVSGTLSLGLCISAGDFSPTAILVMLVTNWTAASLGATLLCRTGLISSRTTTWPACWLTGILALSLFVLAASLALDISAGTGLLIGILLSAILARYRPAANRDASPGRVDLAAVVLICVATLAWSWRAIHAVPDLRETGTFNAWSDYFIHAGEIAQFANLSALHARSIFAADATLPLYHYASYMLPAAIASLAGTPALVCATSLWTPLAFLVLGFGAFTLGAELEGRAGGLAAVAAVLLLPDAAWYGLSNPFLDFHWLLQISSSGAFAVGLALLSLAFLQAWVTQGRPALWVAAVVSALLVSPFRIHIATVLIPTVAVASLVYWRARFAWRALAAGGLVGAAAIVVLLAEGIPRAPHFLSDPMRPLAFLRELHAIPPNNYAGFFQAADAYLPAGLTLVVGMVLLLLAAFGILLPLYLLLLPVTRRSGKALPSLIVLSYVAIVLAFPVTPQEPDEFQHRPFVLVYAVLAVWCAAMLLRWAKTLTPAAAKPRWLVPVVLLLLPFPFLLSPWAQQSRLEWGSRYSVTAVPKGLQLMAEEIRLHSVPTAVMAVPQNDNAPALSALAERAMFYPGEEFLRIQSGLDANALKARETIQTTLLGAGSIPAFWRIACAHGIEIVAAFPDTRLEPDVRASATWNDGGYAIIANRDPCPAPP
jgi:hypothetical protein